MCSGKPTIVTGRSGRDADAAFREKHGLQCGYCTTGMIMTAVDVIDRGMAKDDPSVRRALEGNLCRCTGYQNIVGAVLVAAERITGGAS